MRKKSMVGRSEKEHGSAPVDSMEQVDRFTKERIERAAFEKNFTRAIGLMHEVVITAGKAGFESHHWSHLAHSERLAGRVKLLLDAYYSHLNWAENEEELRVAMKILGDNNVLGNYDVVAVWGGDGHDLRGGNWDKQKFLPGWQATLEQCAKENAAETALWKLIYIQGLSLKALAKRCRYHSLCPYGGAVGICTNLEEETGADFDEIPLSGYHLINLKPVAKVEAPDIVLHPAAALEALLTDDRYQGRSYYKLGDTGCQQGNIFIYGEWPHGSMDGEYLGVSFRPGQKAPTIIARPICSVVKGS